MDVFEAIRTRRSIRSYLDKPLEEEKLTQVLGAGRLAPSASNRQEWRFVVVQGSETRKRLADAACGQKFVAEAPVVIACCAVESDRMLTCGHPAYAIDVAIAIDHMTLAATALGLGTCWIGAFSERKVKRVLGLSEDLRPIAILPLGYEAE